MNKFKQIELENIIELRKEKYNPLESDINKPCIELEHFDQETGQINGFIPSLEQKSIKNVFYKGDVLFGKLRPYLKKYWLAEFDGVCSSEAWVLKPKNNNIITKNFLFYLVQSELFIRIANISSGSKMPRADWNYISEYPFSIPPLKEQEKIAEILLSCDKAIRLTTQIITQLKQRNQGLTQQLLTGEKSWKKSVLKNIAKIKKGEQLNVLNLNNKHKYPSYSGGITPSGYTDKYNTEKDTIIISEGGNSCGYINFIQENFWSGGHCYSIVNSSISKDINKMFLFYFLKKNQEEIMRLRVGSGLPNIQKRDIELFEIEYPTLTEQNTIAQILDTAHQELKLYEQKLQLLQEQKKTLMQKLLTGEVLTVKK